jgi:hypothetical protein
VVDDGDIGRTSRIVVHAHGNDRLAACIMKRASEQNRVVYLERPYIRALGNLLDVRIDCNLTLAKTFLLGPCILIGQTGIALEKPIESQGTRSAMLDTQFRNCGVFLEHNDLVKVHHDDVRLHL